MRYPLYGGYLLCDRQDRQRHHPLQHSVDREKFFGDQAQLYNCHLDIPVCVWLVLGLFSIYTRAAHVLGLFSIYTRAAH